MAAETPETVRQLVDGTLPWPALKNLMSDFKDPHRFDTYLAVLQEQVPWEDVILLPLGPHLFVVQTPDGRRITKTRAGADLGDYRENWKLRARVFVRDTEETLREVYPEMMHCTPGWMELREYYDPVDGTLLEVEAVPPGYPVVHTFQPDLETFYAQWLGRPLQPEVTA